MNRRPSFIKDIKRERERGGGGGKEENYSKDAKDVDVTRTATQSRKAIVRH